MAAKRINIQLCGFGGQGIVLAAVILGTAAVTRGGMHAVQTQSYGSEARGGECQSEVLVAAEEIGSPLADSMDLLVAMSPSALDKYLPRLRPGGWLIVDPEFVSAPQRDDIETMAVPATATAAELGVTLAANMVMLGFIQHTTGLFSLDDLLEVVTDNVPTKFLGVNHEAVKRGVALAEAQGVNLDG